ncbi:MAG TPA: alpha-glucuronidase family glycosyl hydrolase, partial [Sphaerochaeta sp.]|nr:alpha-glucuronidase family glycosyl hydrolase [Sphaerochaeta sp.]
MQTIMTTTAGLDALDLICDGTVLPIIVDSADRNGVSRAAGALADDLSSVLGVRPEVQERRGAGSCIIVGTLGSSSAVDELAARLLIDVEYLRGHDEAFTIAVVDEPASLVICGSDRRGTIYGIYEISRQSGVNPWHFWLNVPPKETEHLYAKKGVVIKEHPAVRWRGIFLNDEAPALTNWILNTYGTVKPSQDPPI